MYIVSLWSVHVFFSYQDINDQYVLILLVTDFSID